MRPLWTAAVFTVFGSLVAGCSGEEEASPAQAQATDEGRRDEIVQDPAGAHEPPSTAGDDGSARGAQGFTAASASPSMKAEILEATAEQWGEELAVEKLNQPLNGLKRHMMGRDDAPGLDAIAAAGAVFALPVPGAEEARDVTSGVESREWTVLSTADVDAAAWVEGLAAYRAQFQRLRYVVLKPKYAEFTNAEKNGLLTHLKWRVNGTTESGGLRHDSGVWAAHWQRTVDRDAKFHCGTCGATGASGSKHCGAPMQPGPGSGKWWLTSLEPKSMTTLESDQVHFVEDTLHAFKGTSADPRLPARTSPETFGRPSLAVADIDGDGDPDLVTTLPLRLLVNNGDGTFKEETGRLGIKNDNNQVGVLIHDFDNDGDADIFVGSRARNMLLLQQPDGRFRATPAGPRRAGKIGVNQNSLAAHDVDGDGYLDIFICSHGNLGAPGPDSIEDATNGDRNLLLRGRPGGAFDDVTEKWGFEAEGTRWALAAAWGDADLDGDMDLYVANDFGRNVLYTRDDGDGPVHFTAVIESPETLSTGFSMSAMWKDLDGDDDNDMYVSNMSSTAASRLLAMPGAPAEGSYLRKIMEMLSRGNSLLIYDGDTLAEAPLEQGGVDANWAWGTVIFDYDCDGDLDIGCLNGWVSAGDNDGRDL